MRRSRPVVIAGVAAVVMGAAWAAWPLAQERAAQNAAPPASLADLKPVEQDDRMLLAPPAFSLKSDGTGELTFDTGVAAPACRVYVGVPNPSADLEMPFFPVAIREALKEPATSHRVAVDVRRVETWWPAAGPDGVRESDVYFRIEAYDSRTGGVRYFETRARVANVKGQYEKRTSIVLGPVIDQVGTASALVSWNTDRAAAGTVELWAGSGDQKIGEFAAAAPASDHPVITITGLKAGTAYRYRVRVTDAAGGPAITASRLYPFRSAPPKGADFKFVYMSDGRASTGGGLTNFNGSNAAVTPRLFADGYRRGGAFGLYAGDLMIGGTSNLDHWRMMIDTWRHANDPVAHSMPIYEGVGNHESIFRYYTDAQGTRYSTARLGDTSTEAEFGARFVNPGNGPDPEVQNGVTGPPYAGTVYSFDFGNSHFVMLNSDYWTTSGGPSRDNAFAWRLLGGNREGYLMTNQLAWLDRDLAAARKRGVSQIFVATHEPPFPVGGHLADAMWWRGLNDPAIPSGDVGAMRGRFLAMLSKYDVAAVLCGDEHAYARLDVDKAMDPNVTRPFVQILSGGAGAPLYQQDLTAPWTKNVRKYASLNHYLLVTVNATGVRFEAIDIDGRVFDSGVIR